MGLTAFNRARRDAAEREAAAQAGGNSVEPADRAAQEARAGQEAPKKRGRPSKADKAAQEAQAAENTAGGDAGSDTKGA